jgi:hypothetical protein
MITATALDKPVRHRNKPIQASSTPDREQWLNDYAHTEWTIQEISSGIPLKYLTERL